MKTLSSLSLDELQLMKEVLEKEELQGELNRLLETKQAQPLLVEQYQSSRLPEFYQDYQEQCVKLLSELSYFDLHFLMHTARCSAGNNCGGDFRFSEGQNFSAEYHCYFTEASIQLLDDYFSNHPEKIYYFEGLYNTINYIKTFVSTMLNSGKNIETPDDLLIDFKEKKQIVTKNIGNISTHLLSLRNSVPNSRLCVGNQGLTRNVGKYGETITGPQERFISSIAFGSTLEKLKEENYEEAERLLFVPQCKMLKK